MSRLNKLQIYSIRWLNSQNKNIDFIVNDLKLTKKQVIDTIEKFSSPNSSNNIQTKTSKTSRDLMISETSNKKSKNVSIMTKEASMQNDMASKNLSAPKNDTSKYIFRPKK